MTSVNVWNIEDAIADDDRLAGIGKDVDALISNYNDAERDDVPGDEHVFIKTMGPYSAYAVDLDYLWRWEIYLGDDGLVQHGASLTLASATEAASHVLAYFAVRDAKKSGDPGHGHRP
jgi:soluble methane monooxygenase-binding protein MmoD